MHYIIHNYSDGTTEWGEELKEIPKVFLVQYWPWTERGEPHPMVVARYQLVEVVESELSPTKGGKYQKVFEKMRRTFEEEA